MVSSFPRQRVWANNAVCPPVLLNIYLEKIMRDTLQDQHTSDLNRLQLQQIAVPAPFSFFSTAPVFF